ncbi:endonuclease domain-containing protein [Aestuariivirga litoralis]|uniref:endonuclease domain-containing protein n=1 Tax=Aestuariivirga litoralis TaxID=2650924 RepID=UPI0018C55877|nr:endonuclease domain-containing protein [Aestuariivirga litoralis]MBG1232257.1 endonuclease domain-containing protein [Aestuariivirga litoralis]
MPASSPSQTLPFRGRAAAKQPGGAARARQLRNSPTDAEKKMWHILRDIDWPKAHFRRQVQIGPYFADFLSHHFKLIIEVDGSQHSEDAGLRKDAARTEFLNKEGFKVLRFFNIDVLKNSAGVHHAIECELQALIPTPNPSPQGGGAEQVVQP